MQTRTSFLYIAWLTALISTLGSLFFSIFLKLPPCDLCWYQRIFMFPLVIVLGVGYLKEDKYIQLYSLPLILLGWFLSIYHNLLYYKWIEPTITPCSGGVSCTERQLELLGFVSIPLMSFTSFTLLFILVLLHTYMLEPGGAHNEKK